MKSFIVLALFVAAAVAAPPLTPDGAAEILAYESDNIGVDGFRYGFKTSNGIEQSETGAIQGLGSEDEAIEVSGSFSYPGPDGVLYTVVYTAGRDGFKPQAAHLPQA